MPRRIFKSLTRRRHQWKGRWFMRPFRLLLENQAYWSLNRRNVTRAFALGLFVSFIPLPVHLVFAAILALALRLNIPAAVAGTLIVNPLTMVPTYVFSYWVGCHLLGIHERRVAFELSWDWVTTGLLPIWKPFLLGCLVVGTSAALAGYIVLGGIWHLSLVLRYHRRRGTGAGKESGNSEKSADGRRNDD
jgi:uncharacterized protein (DUF2062 family)